MSRVGVVAIGRNEGERLRQCLSSAIGCAAHVVYVDSGSTDGSAELARQIGADVVALDMNLPFTAARARDAGFERLKHAGSESDFIHFVDGDCEIVAGWIERAQRELDANPSWAIVCGRRRERHPETSVYNRLCDIEWNTPVGEALACGGDAMIRTKAFIEVGGYDPGVIAGEEPELCVRLRHKGWKIYRLDAEMTLHDAAMIRFGQWWKRNVRAGHAYAEGAAMHGRPPERHWVRQTRSNWFWGLILPLIILAAAWPTCGASFVLLAGYLLLAYRIRRGAMRSGMAGSDARVFARFVVIGKFAQMLGQLKYYLGRLTGRRSRLIEYKGAAAA